MATKQSRGKVVDTSNVLRDSNGQPLVDDNGQQLVDDSR